MKRFLVIARKDDYTITSSFDSCADACEYAIKKSMTGCNCEVRDNASGKTLKGWW